MTIHWRVKEARILARVALRHIRVLGTYGLRHKRKSQMFAGHGPRAIHYIRLMLTSWKLKRSGGSAQIGLGVRPAHVL
jgi:hypothetical protein